MVDYRFENKCIEVFKLLIILIIIGSMNIAEASIFTTGMYPDNSFIDPTVLIDVGNFSIGKESYIAPFTSFTGEYAYIGNYSNVQDGGSNSGRIIIKDDAVIAHGADLIGEVEIGSTAFIGFNNVIKDSKIGDGAYIGVGSKVIGVDIPAHKSVPPGSVIDSTDDIEKLELVNEEQEDFVNEVIEVNRALAIGYSQLFEKNGLNAFGAVGPNGGGDIIVDGKDILAFNGSHEPVIGKGSIVGSSRIIGEVFIGENSKVENGTSIRGDEGVPIRIGKNAEIGKDNIFHSLNDKEIKIGDNFKLAGDSVVHGPLVIGNDVNVGSRAIVFKSTIGDNVVIGDNAIVVGVKVHGGTIIPSDSIVTLQKDVKKFTAEAQQSPESKPKSIFELIAVAFIPIALGLAGSYFLRNKRL